MPFIGNQPSAVPLTSADITDGIITSAKIADGSIVNADINASAGIDSTKITGLSSDYVLLASTDASSSASISFDGYFSSTYTNYKIIFSTVNLSTSTKLNMRVRKSNSDQTGSDYRYVYDHIYRNSGASGTGLRSEWGDTRAELDIYNNDGTNGRRNGFFDIYDPLNSEGFKSIFYSGFNMQNDDEIDVNYGGIFYAQTGALSGISIYPTSGNITSGKFKLYGIK